MSSALLLRQSGHCKETFFWHRLPKNWHWSPGKQRLPYSNGFDLASEVAPSECALTFLVLLTLSLAMGCNRVRVFTFDVFSVCFLWYHQAWSAQGCLLLRRHTADPVQNKFLKWLLGVSEHYSNNACRAETGKSLLRIEADCKSFRFSLTSVRPEENDYDELCKEMYKDKATIKTKSDNVLWATN